MVMMKMLLELFLLYVDAICGNVGDNVDRSVLMLEMARDDISQEIKEVN